MIASYNALRLIGTLDWDAIHTCLFGRIIVPSYEQGISDVNHLFQRNVQEVSQLSDSVCLINAWLGDINGCRASNSDRKLRNESVKNRFDPLPLGVIGIPFVLFF